MNDPNNRKNLPQPGGPPERFHPKMMIFYLVVVLLLIGVWAAFSSPQTGHVSEMSVTQVLQALDKKEIESMTLRPDPGSGTDWYSIVGQKKNPLYKPGSDANAPGAQPEAQSLLFEASGRLTPERYDRLAAFAGADEKGGNALMATLLVDVLLPLGMLLLIYFLLIRQFKLAGRGAMAFGKSRARMLTRDREKVTFKEVAGCDEAKEEVSEVVEFLKDPKKFQRIGGRVPKGVLMVGPPGTGKTLLARAVAGEADVPFFSISGSDFVEMFVGVGAARVRDMFEQGRKNAPCIIFIDEIDAVGRQRGAGLGGGNDEREQTLNSLLVEMDGFDGHEGVIIIAATNRPDVLDSALLRPGRFDRQIIIDLPDLNGRAEILKVHAKKIKLAKEVDLHLAARNTPGLSGADLANLLNEAALIAARYNKNEVEMVDIDEAREKIAFGRERRKLMDDEDKRIVAYHEAGHAVVQAVVDDGHLPLHKVTIIPRGQSLGSTMFAPKKDMLNHGLKRLMNRLCCLMGGRVAEELQMGDVTSGAAGDIKTATKLARHMVCDWGMSPMGPIAFGENQEHIFLAKEITRTQNYSEETARRIDAEITAIMDGQYQRAREILTQRRAALDAVAAALLEHETIEGKHVHEILDFGALRSPVTPSTAKPAPVDPEKEALPEKVKRKTEDLGPGPQPASVPA